MNRKRRSGLNHLSLPAVIPLHFCQLCGICTKFVCYAWISGLSVFRNAGIPRFGTSRDRTIPGAIVWTPMRCRYVGTSSWPSIPRWRGRQHDLALAILKPSPPISPHAYKPLKTKKNFQTKILEFNKFNYLCLPQKKRRYVCICGKLFTILSFN